MKNIFRFTALMCMTMAALAGMPGKAQAAERISTVSLKIEADIKDGQDMDENAIEVKPGGSGYKVESVEIMSRGFYWELGDVPEIVVTVQASDNNYFNIRSKDQIHLHGCNAQYISSSRDNAAGSLSVTMRLDPVALCLEETKEVRWDGDRIGAWLADEHATGYELRLYRGDKPVGRVEETDGSTYDFSASMSRPGTYYYKVRAVNRAGTEIRGRWTKSPEWVIDPI